MLKALKILGVTLSISALVLITLAVAYVIVPVVVSLIVLTVIFFVVRDHYENK